nr:adenosylcobinamide-GDP ribazoletransferase [Nocardioides daedukensis]
MLGTLSVLRVPAPTRVDRSVAGTAMILAPVGGAVLAVLTAVPLWLLTEQQWSPSALVLAAAVLAALALLTRGMHLDGLADVADGLGSGRRGEAGLAIMKRSDIGPFGVVTLLLALLLQAAALAQAISSGEGAAVLVLALVVSRGLLPLLCTQWFPAARPDGLGATVATSVGTSRLLASAALTVVLSAGLVWLLGSSDLDAPTCLRLAAASVAALVPGLLLALRARNRFGGVNGDVYGAGVETTFTATLLFAAVVL